MAMDIVRRYTCDRCGLVEEDVDVNANLAWKRLLLFYVTGTKEEHLPGSDPTQISGSVHICPHCVEVFYSYWNRHHDSR